MSKLIDKTIGSSITNITDADVTGTVLDPDGGIIELPIRLINFRGRSILGLDTINFDPLEYINQISPTELSMCCADKLNIKKLPNYIKYGTVYLNQIQTHINLLLSAIENYKAENHTAVDAARKFLQQAFCMLEDTIIGTIAGKHGLIAKNVAGIRIPYSMMTPFAGTHLCEHTEVMIPLSDAKSIDAWDGDIIMALRQPLLRGEGMVFLTARIVPDSFADSTRIPWAVFNGMNADNDGDLVFLTNISKHLDKCEAPEREAVLREIEHARMKDESLHTYVGSLMLLDSDNKPTYDEGKSWKDISNRLDDTLGLSFGIEDVYKKDDNNSMLEILEAHMGINPDNITKYSKVITEEEWIADVKKTAEALFYTKNGLGLVGAIGSYCLLIANNNHPECIPAATAIKHDLSQAVLDAKHGDDVDYINECLHSLMKIEAFESATIDERIAALVKHGFNHNVIKPLFDVLKDEGIIKHIYDNYPCYLMITAGSNYLSNFIRFTHGEPDASGPGKDVGAWWDNNILPYLGQGE